MRKSLIDNTYQILWHLCSIVNYESIANRTDFFTRFQYSINNYLTTLEENMYTIANAAWDECSILNLKLRRFAHVFINVALTFNCYRKHFKLDYWVLFLLLLLFLLGFSITRLIYGTQFLLFWNTLTLLTMCLDCTN